MPDKSGIAEVYTPDMKWVGRTDTKLRVGRTLIGKTVGANEIQFSDFGPMEIPEWLRSLPD